MTTYYLNGTPITEGSDITLSGFTYPYSWLEGTSPSIRASLGIESQDDTNYNSKYYWSKNNPKALEDAEAVDKDGDPVYVQVWDPEFVVEGLQQTGAMVNTNVRVINKGLKTTCTTEIKTTTNDLLKPTDYYIIRNEVESVEIPTDVVTYRAAVIAESDRVVTAIAAVDTIEELIEVMSSIAWPKAE
jgi:hypothetical protein